VPASAGLTIVKMINAPMRWRSRVLEQLEPVALCV
jgi:hypothetical protein